MNARRDPDPALLRPDDPTGADDEVDLASRADRSQRVLPKDDEIGGLADFDRPERSPLTQELGSRPGRGRQRLPRRESALDQQLQLAVKRCTPGTT